MNEHEMMKAAKSLFNSCGRLCYDDADDIEFVMTEYETDHETAVNILYLVDDMMIETVYGY